MTTALSPSPPAAEPVRWITAAERRDLLCDCADEANSDACPGCTDSALHLWTEKLAADILASAERIAEAHRREGATEAARIGRQHTDAALAEVERRLVNIDTPALDKATLNAAAEIVADMRADILKAAS